MSKSRTKRKQKMDALIVVAIIGLLGTIVTALLNSSVITALLQKSPAATAVSTGPLPDNFLPSSASLFFGPKNGTLPHEADGGIFWFKAEVSLINFVAEATFVNPYSASDHPWIMLLFFREGYRVWVKSENEWGSGFSKNSIWTDGQDGQLSDALLSKNNGEFNHVRLIASDDLGCLYINNIFVSEFSLSGLVQPGDIAVGIGEPEYTIPGEVTEFKDYKIYTVSSINECPK